MASIINASSSGSGGIVQTADASGVLQLQSNGTVALTTSGANIGLGGVTPSTWSAGSALEIGFAGTGLFSTAATQTVLTANTNYNSAYKYSSTGAASYYQQYLGQHQLFSAPSGSSGASATFTQVMAVGKDLTFSLQGSTQSSGTGIAFPATQSASSDANTLDDYEEGTWTPTLFGSGGSAGAQAYSIQAGKYTKIGNMVILTGYLALSNKGSWTGNVQIGGMPFTVFNSSGAYGGTMFYGSQITLPANCYGCGAYPVLTTTASQLIYSNNTGTTSMGDYAGQINSNTQIGAFTIVYPTNT
jgi:hypothetical protein